MANIDIERIDVEDVIIHDKSRFNSNNHWENDQEPSDYKEQLECGEAKYWIDHYKQYKVISIDSKELGWLLRASEMGKITNRFPRTFDDELESLLDSHPQDAFDGKPYFVRTKTVSLKYGCHGVGPYYDLKSVIESAVTCIMGHAPINHTTTELDFYLIEWTTINPDREFRMFVCDNRVTCISQQYTTKSNDYLLDHCANDEERNQMCTKWVQTLTTFWETEIRPVIRHTVRYSIDIALKEDGADSPYFIEINCFGREYAAGSSLFHWIIDGDKLYGLVQPHTIFFRYAISRELVLNS